MDGFGDLRNNLQMDRSVRMNQEYEIVEQVYRAKKDVKEADRLVRQYLPFIKSETAKFIHRAPVEGADDELSIAMFAFHECVLGYNRTKGAFLHFASVGIRNRLIDYYRKEKRHVITLPLEQARDDKENGRTLLDTVAAARDEMEDLDIRRATKGEIEEFSGQLAEYGLSLSDIAGNCPRQERTLSACHRALAYAKVHTEILKMLMTGKKLPLAQLAAGSGVPRKTLERHRNYMVAILLAYTNGFEIIRGHLCQIAPEKGGREA